MHPDNLPSDISHVVRKNGPKFDTHYFDAFYQKLKTTFLETPPKHNNANTVSSRIDRLTENPLCLKIRVNLDCEIWVDEKLILRAEANKITRLPLKKGTFWLEFVSCENSKDRYVREYTIVDTEELLNVDIKSVASKRIEKERDEYFEKVIYKKFVNASTGKYGFKDVQTNKVVISPQYAHARNFYDGMAAVALNNLDSKNHLNKWGYINKRGELVIPYKYEYIGYGDDKMNHNFAEGLARVKLNGKYGFIDKNGREVIPFKYDYAGSFREELSIAMFNGKYGFIDKSGREVVPLIYDSVNQFSEGLAEVEQNKKFGFIDKSGNVVIPFTYDYAMSFKEGLAPVRRNDKWGYINKQEKEIIQFKYERTFPFEEGVARVYYKDLLKTQGLIDKTGKEIVPKGRYISVSCFKEGLAEVTMIGGRSGFINKMGKEVIPTIYRCASCFNDGYARVREWNPNHSHGYYGKEGFIDKEGNIAVALEYDTLYDFDEGIAIGRIKERTVYIQKS